MSYEIAFYGPDDDPDDGEAGDHFFLANSGGWGAFIDWATALPEATYPALYRLCDDGTVTGTDALREQIKRALRAEPPPVEEVFQIGKHLLKLIRRGDPEETAVVEA